ncbi:MAG: uracil phosphoribosyltransferase [Acidimicrobiia bacterium]|nr:MAG: uracil phosphoribosyltransferase [Acidimicrobiia bacterium]
MSLTVLDHPLASHYLTILRDRTTLPEEFRAAARRLCYFLVHEATHDLPVRERPVETPLETTSGHETSKVVAIAVLRAGLGLLDAVIDLIPYVKVGFAGVQRNEETAEPIEYYFKPPDLERATVLVLEPMLATGGSLAWAVGKAKESGASRIIALCVVAAPAGVQRMESEHPDVRIVAAALDRDLSDHFYIQPGLGDMGDRLFGTT